MMERRHFVGNDIIYNTKLFIMIEYFCVLSFSFERLLRGKEYAGAGTEIRGSQKIN